MLGLQLICGQAEPASDSRSRSPVSSEASRVESSASAPGVLAVVAGNTQNPGAELQHLGLASPQHRDRPAEIKAVLIRADAQQQLKLTPELQWLLQRSRCETSHISPRIKIRAIA